MLNSAPAYDPLESPDTLLSRRVDVTRVPVSAIAWASVLALGVLTRLVQWGSWPLGAGEARVATDALALVQGGTISSAAWARPLQTELVGLALFLFGPSQGAVRVVPLLAGLGTIALLVPLRRWIGSHAALAAAFLAAVSPTLTQVARRADAGALLTLLSVATLVLLLRYLTSPAAGSAATAGLCAGLLVLTNPLGWVALPLLLLAAWAIAPGARARIVDLAPAALGLAVALIVLATALLTHPAGFADFFSASFRELWDTSLVTAGSAWQMTPFQLLIDEFLPVVLGLYSAGVALFSRDADLDAPVRATRALFAWALLAAVIASILGGKNLPLYAFATLPWIVLGGIGLAAVLDAVDWREVARGRGLGFLAVAFLTLAALVDTIGLLTTGPSGGTVIFVVTGAIFVLLVLVPLAAFSLWLANRLDQPARPLLEFGAVVLLLVITLHSTFLLGATNLERPGEPLTAGSTAPAVADLIGRLGRLSEDMTTFDQSPQDPTGGHGLTIVVDQSIAQPFAWYFRDYPNLSIVTAANAPAAARTTEVIIARPDHAAALVPSGSGFVVRSYALALASPASLEAPDWQTLLSSIVNPSEIRRFAGFLMDRQVTASPAPQSFDLALRTDLAQKMYGPGAQ